MTNPRPHQADCRRRVSGWWRSMKLRTCSSIRDAWRKSATWNRFRRWPCLKGDDGLSATHRALDRRHRSASGRCPSPRGYRHIPPTRQRQCGSVCEETARARAGQVSWKRSVFCNPSLRITHKLMAKSFVRPRKCGLTGQGEPPCSTSGPARNRQRIGHGYHTAVHRVAAGTSAT